MPEDAKLPALSDRAFRLWVNAICYCSRGETDGRVPAALMTSLSISATKRAVDELLSAGLLLDRGGEYEVHNYLKFNPSRERLQALKRAGKQRTAKWRGQQRDASPAHHDAPASSAVSLTRATAPTTERSEEKDQGEGRLTRELVEEACSILSAVERWSVDPVGIENAAGTEPDGDLLRACRLAATWGSDPDWQMGPAASVRSALRKLVAEKPKFDEKAELNERDTAALNRAMGMTA